MALSGASKAQTGRRSVATEGTRERLLAWIELALIAVGFAVVFFLLPHGLFADDVTRWEDAELLRSGELSDGKYSMVMPLVSLPVLELGELAQSRIWWAERFNVVVVALGTLVVMLALRGRVDGRVLRRGVLVLLFASFMTNRLRDYNAEVLTATLATVGIVLLASGRARLAGWACLVVGAVNTPAAIVALAAVAAVETARTRRLRNLAAVPAAAAGIMAEAWIRRGDPFTTGYEGDRGFETILPYSGQPGFSFPLLLGVASILFSFGRGLLFFTPGLVLWLSSRTRQLAAGCRPAAALMLAFVAGLVVVYAKWWAWYGGIAWGPRFFAFAAVPASLAIALRLAHAGRSAAADAATLVVLAMSAWVALSGATSDLSFLDFCSENSYALESLCWYVPEYSALWQPVLDFPELTARTGAVVAYIGVVCAYLAAPLVASLAAAGRRAARSRAWRSGWRV